MSTLWRWIRHCLTSLSEAPPRPPTVANYCCSFLWRHVPWSCPVFVTAEKCRNAFRSDCWCAFSLYRFVYIWDCCPGYVLIGYLLYWISLTPIWRQNLKWLSFLFWFPPVLYSMLCCYGLYIVIKWHVIRMFHSGHNCHSVPIFSSDIHIFTMSAFPTNIVPLLFPSAEECPHVLRGEWHTLIPSLMNDSCLCLDSGPLCCENTST